MKCSSKTWGWLCGSAALEAFETYLRDYPRAGSTEQQTVCIDQLIRSFPISLQVQKPSRSFADNLEEDSHDQVLELLDPLFAKSDGIDKEDWRAQIQRMYCRRRGQG